MQTVSILYPNGDDIQFDFEYYGDSHVPMFVGLLGDTVKRTTIAKGLEMLGNPAPYIAVLTLELSDTEPLVAALINKGDEILGDIQNFTNAVPVMQFSDVL